jgi:hypothetical protein
MTLNYRTPQKRRLLSPSLSPDDIERFWSMVPPGPGCREWSGSRQDRGYGKFRLPGRRGAQLYAHRVAFFLTYGRWPVPQCLHTCDNPPCCEPTHLVEGSQADNIADMLRKGRHSPGKIAGTTNPRAKLTPIQVLEIRERFANGETNRSQLGREYGVSNVLVGLIVRRKVWPNLLLPWN